MSHLSILPTVLRDPDLLAASLEGLGLQPERDGQLQGFAQECQPVCVLVHLPGGQSLGWQRQPDGRLSLVGDLQRLSRHTSVQQLLGRITRAYAARLAVREAAASFPPEAVLTLPR